MTHSEFCRDSRIVDLFERQVATATEGLARFETVKKIALLDKEFQLLAVELTPTLKIKAPGGKRKIQRGDRSAVCGKVKTRDVLSRVLSIKTGGSESVFDQAAQQAYP
jgi:hypothetical protein